MEQSLEEQINSVMDVKVLKSNQRDADIENIVEKCVKYFIGTRLSAREYKDMLLVLAYKAKIIGIDKNIKFNIRNKIRSINVRAAEEDKIILNLMSAIDNVVSKNAQYFKDVEDKYKYHYKEIR